jgi:ankyrin repeat protein
MDPASQSFLDQVFSGDVAAVKASLAADPGLAALRTDDSYDHTLPVGSTPLHLAVRQGQEEVVSALLEAGAPLEVRNGAGRTPLHDALQFDLRMRTPLLEAGASLDICHAAFLDHADRVRDLLFEDVSRANETSTGLTPLAWACYGRALNTARLLLELGAKPVHGELLCAAQVGAVEVGRLLLERGLRPDALHRGFNALHAVITTPYTGEIIDFIALLVEFGADVNALTAAGQRPLDLVAFALKNPGSPARAAALLECEALLRDAGGHATAR